MCTAKSPQITPVDPAKTRPVVIRNAYLDGIDPAIKAARSGRSGLRIDPGSPNRSAAPAAVPVAKAPAFPFPIAPPTQSPIPAAAYSRLSIGPRF